MRDTLQQRDASISQLQRDVDAAWAALETEEKQAEGKSRSLNILALRGALSRLDVHFGDAELQKSTADPSREMQSLQVAYNEAPGELKAL